MASGGDVAGVGDVGDGPVVAVADGVAGTGAELPFVASGRNAIAHEDRLAVRAFRRRTVGDVAF